MKAQELRIGNWLYHEPTIDDHEPRRIKAGDLALLSLNGEDDYSYWTPIPLTEEWLIKLNCEGGYFGRNGCFRWVDALGGLVEFAKENTNERAGGLLICKGIEYVHQFQNVVFALTGEELTIKEA